LKKAALTFASYNSLWSFKELTSAIHIRVEPKKHLIHGLFKDNEVELAIQKFGAVEYDEGSNQQISSETEVGIARGFFKSLRQWIRPWTFRIQQ
jgi:hypothetical protein